MFPIKSYQRHSLLEFESCTDYFEVITGIINGFEMNHITDAGKSLILSFNSYKWLEPRSWWELLLPVLSPHSCISIKFLQRLLENLEPICVWKVKPTSTEGLYNASVSSEATICIISSAANYLHDSLINHFTYLWKMLLNIHQRPNGFLFSSKQIVQNSKIIPHHKWQGKAEKPSTHGA